MGVTKKCTSGLEWKESERLITSFQLRTPRNSTADFISHSIRALAHSHFAAVGAELLGVRRLRRLQGAGYAHIPFGFAEYNFAPPGSSCHYFGSRWSTTVSLRWEGDELEEFSIDGYSFASPESR